MVIKGLTRIWLSVVASHGVQTFFVRKAPEVVQPKIRRIKTSDLDVLMPLGLESLV